MQKNIKGSKKKKKAYRRKRMKRRIQSSHFDAYCQYVVMFYFAKNCSEIKTQ